MQVEANRREAFLAEKADAIRSLAKNVVRDVIKIGRHLSEAKGKFGRGDNPEFLTWTNEALGWSKSSVYNFINVYDLVQGGNFPNFGNFDLSSLYLLAAPSTPPEVIAEVAERSQRGEQVTVAQVRELVTASKEAEVHRITAPSRSSTQPEPERPISIVRSSTPTVTTHAVTLSRDVGEALSSGRRDGDLRVQRREDGRACARGDRAWPQPRGSSACRPSHHRRARWRQAREIAER